MTNESVLLAQQLRIHALKMTNAGGGSHIACVFSMADILAVLYSSILKVDPAFPTDPERDRFILSKGHAGAGLYAVLAERGFFDKAWLQTHYQNDSLLSGHVSHKGIPGVEISTGSLGHGLPIACGKALALKTNGSQSRVFVLLGDGECDEGSNWEAALFAHHFELGNLITIIDYNKMQSLKSTEETLKLEPLRDKWAAFGFEVFEVDGHDHPALHKVFSSLATSSKKPKCVIGHTVKGKGVSFMERNILWHYRVPRGDEYTAALNELLQKG